MKQVQLLTRPGCHLCDDARAAVAAATRAAGTTFSEVNVDDDRELRAEYGDMVPVVLLDGVQYGYFTIDAIELQAALTR
ncbi:Glutaredoxin [Nakamurella panacisegetis]|uniref:Glutaredoxin n=1 Tax=Nakamurella panacisegetis TaxID=1090615 RepID=A0A1H0NR41_9ACTN|nr:glutaredoxin family protein [Nakamurella panacisegetis]SDO95174.1 Glutaredoxin [Nakamurella panacisegetis]